MKGDISFLFSSLPQRACFDHWLASRRRHLSSRSRGRTRPAPRGEGDRVLRRSCMIVVTCLLAAGHCLAVVTLRIGETNGIPPFPQTNGKQIGRTSAGIWLVAYDGKTPAGERAA